MTVAVDLEADPSPAVRVQVVAEHAAGRREKIVASRTPKTRNGHLQTAFTGLAPGAYDVRVSGLTPSSPITPVTAPVLVWAPAHDL